MQECNSDKLVLKTTVILAVGRSNSGSPSAASKAIHGHSIEGADVLRCEKDPAAEECESRISAIHNAYAADVTRRERSARDAREFVAVLRVAAPINGLTWNLERLSHCDLTISVEDAFRGIDHPKSQTQKAIVRFLSRLHADIQTRLAPELAIGPFHYVSLQLSTLQCLGPWYID